MQIYIFFLFLQNFLSFFEENDIPGSMAKPGNDGVMDNLERASAGKCIKIAIFAIANQNYFTMPVRKVPGGYQWGQHGKVYPTKEQAEAQGRAAYASGYKEPKKK